MCPEPPSGCVGSRRRLSIERRPRPELARACASVGVRCRSRMGRASAPSETVTPAGGWFVTRHGRGPPKRADNSPYRRLEWVASARSVSTRFECRPAVAAVVEELIRTTAPVRFVASSRPGRGHARSRGKAGYTGARCGCRPGSPRPLRAVRSLRRTPSLALRAQWCTHARER